MELPPIIANRVLKRQPLNILYLKNHLMSYSQPSANIPPTFTHTNSAERHQEQSFSGRHFEEPLPIRPFTKEQTENMKREGGQGLLSCDQSGDQQSHTSNGTGETSEHAADSKHGSS